jgi:ABC-type Na+ efflux pump permease subunit
VPCRVAVGRNTITDLVQEKETRVKELMLIMSVSSTALITAKLLFYALFFLPSSILLVGC